MIKYLYSLYLKLPNTFLVLFLFTMFQQGTITSQSLMVRKLPITNQLPSNSVHRLFQDKEGYIWMGTSEGICRYDGYQVKTFRCDIYNPDRLTSNEIRCITEDFNHNIWIGTSEGLSILNKKNYNISPLPHELIRHREIRDILVASDSTIWVGIENFVVRYSKNFKVIGKYYHIDGDSTSIPNGGINSLFEDSYKNIWLLLWTEGLHKFNTTTNHFIPYPKIGETNNPFKMFQDTQNNYWIGTWNDGLYSFAPNSNSNNYYKTINVKSKDPNTNEKTFFSFTQDDDLKYIWAMSLSGLHAFAYNKDSELSEVDLQHVFDNTNNIFSEIIKDNKGSLWIGAFSEGVFKVDFEEPILDNFPLNIVDKKKHISPSFTTLIEDTDGDIWANQNRFGLCIYDKVKNQFNTYAEINVLKKYNDLKNTNIISICGTDKEIWISNTLNAKILKIAKNNQQIRIIGEEDLTLVTDGPGITQHLFTDKNGNIWIGTNYSLFVKDTKTGEIKLIQENFGSVSEITEDTNNNIWISTFNNGLYKIASSDDLEKLSLHAVENTNISKHIQSIAADHSGKLWIGTKEGNLYCYNTTENKYIDKTLNCGLKGEAILDIVIDKYNHIWISTYKSIIEFNPSNNAYFTYNNCDESQVNSFVKGACFLNDDSKRIYFAGNKGYTTYFPSEKLKLPPIQTNVTITDIKIQNESIYNTHNNNKFNKATSILTLSPDDKNIEIDFSALDYKNPQKIKYAYKLDGIDNDWIEAKKDRLFALYSQLKKGKYTFLVKSTDSHNLWNTNITKLTIIKNPSVFETNFAYFIYFSIITIVIFFLIRIILGRIKLKNHFKMAQFEKQKTEELTQTKLNYFTNITHDLLTPLTIISCIIDDIETTTSKYTSQFSSMRSNVVRLKRLLQQILDFKRVEEGKMKLKVTQSDIKSFINDLCYNHFEPLFSKKNIQFKIKADQKNIIACFDADKIDKVLFNILSNAFKFTPQNGAVTLTLSIQIIDGFKYLNINISDTGIGIKENELDKIFTRFYTNKSLNTDDTHGIGLSLCKDLIELHHGKLSVKSKVNQGTTFTVSIPIERKSYSINEIATNNILDIANVEETEANEAIETSPETKTETQNDINILLVEDNLELLQLMHQLLSKTYNVLTAKHGKEALGIINKTDIDIVISDVMMPEMDGIELCKTIKNNIEISHTSVILLTAKNSINDKVECYNAGADAFLSKPFEMKILDARIRNFIATIKDKQQKFKSNADINISNLDYPSMDEQFLQNAVAIIETNLSESSFDINAFAEELNISKSSLYRKIKTITGLSPIEFIKNIKLKHASLMLKNNHAVSEVAYAVGFSDPKYFSACFKAEFNISPKEFQKNGGENRSNSTISINLNANL